MGILSAAVEQLANKGVIEKEVIFDDIKVTLRILGVEEQLLSESILPNNALRQKYGVDEKEFRTLADTIAKYRTVSTLCFAIHTINGQKPVDETLSASEQFKQRMEFFDDLMKLNVSMIDELIKEYQNLSLEYRTFFDNAVDNAGK